MPKPKLAEFLIDDDRPNDDLVFPPDFGRGLVPPTDKEIKAAGMRAPPADMKVIPRDEWDARIKEQDENKSSLQHVRERAADGALMPSLDQNGQGYCATADTEILTEKGWVPYPEYNFTDPVATVNRRTHAMEFQRPFQRHVYEYDGPMIYSTNRRIDFGVTPDHQMYVRKFDQKRGTLSDKYSFVKAGELGWYAGLLHAPSGQIGTELVELEIEGDRRYDGDDLLALLALIVSDGYAGGSESTRNWVSFYCFRDEDYPSVAALAARTGFRESPSRRGVFTRYGAGALANWLRANAYVGGNTGAANKRIPDLVKVASTRQIKHFLNRFNDRVRDGSQFYSSSKRLIDDLQELFLRIGKRSSIGGQVGKVREIPYAGNASGMIRSNGCYTLTVGEVDRLCIDKKKHLETERYKGLVYCAAVPNHTLLTRRNGSVLISSNCWAYSTTSTVMLARARDGMPYRRMSGHSVACPVKNHRDEGGWCGLSAKRWRDVGGVPVDVWPEKSMQRSYNNDATWNVAKDYRIAEDWVDLTQSVYDQNMTFDQVATCLLVNVPVAVDFNWWSHSVCAIRLVRVEAGSYGLLILNSWTDGWGDKGTGVLRGSKAIPNGAVATRVVTEPPLPKSAKKPRRKAA